MDTQTFSIVMTVVVAHFLALISPGPDFLMMVRSALRNSRRRAIGMALGIALANGIYIVLCIIGVGAAVAHSLWLMTLQDRRFAAGGDGRKAVAQRRKGKLILKGRFSSVSRTSMPDPHRAKQTNHCRA